MKWTFNKRLVLVTVLAAIAIVYFGLRDVPRGNDLQAADRRLFLESLLPRARSVIPNRQLIQVSIADVTIDSVNTQLVRETIAGIDARDSLYGMYANVYTELWTAPYNAILRGVSSVAKENDSSLVYQVLWHEPKRSAFLFDSTAFVRDEWDSLTALLTVAGGDTLAIPDTAGVILDNDHIRSGVYMPQFSQLAIRFKSRGFQTHHSDTASSLAAATRTAVLANTNADSVVIMLQFEMW